MSVAVIPLTQTAVAESQVATPSTHRAPARFYRPELDALRFFAFLSVFLCHALPFSDTKNPYSGHLWRWVQGVREAGNFGVCLFFLLSSYLITELLRNEKAATGSIHMQAFYVRRALRIWPLYFTVLFGVAAVGVFLPASHMTTGQIWAYLFFAANWFAAMHLAIKIPLTWLWSISVEEQFYLVWPALAKLGGMRGIAIGSVIFVPVSLAAIVMVEKWKGVPIEAVWLNSLVQFQFFAIGALLALGLDGKLPKFRLPQRMGLVLLGFVCWITASGACMMKRPNFDPGTWRLVTGYELVGLGSVCFLLAALGWTMPAFGRFLVPLGKASYGLYVFHGLALDVTSEARLSLLRMVPLHGGAASLAFLVERLSALGLTIGVALLSYRYLETPFLQLKKRFTFVASRPV